MYSKAEIKKVAETGEDGAIGQFKYNRAREYLAGLPEEVRVCIKGFGNPPAGSSVWKSVTRNTQTGYVDQKQLQEAITLLYDYTNPLLEQFPEYFTSRKSVLDFARYWLLHADDGVLGYDHFDRALGFVVTRIATRHGLSKAPAVDKETARRDAFRAEHMARSRARRSVNLETENQERNKAIYQQWQAGGSLRSLAAEFDLSKSRIAKIVEREDQRLADLEFYAMQEED